MRKKNAFKRYLALLLSLVLITTLMPVQAFAEEYDGGEYGAELLVITAFATLADNVANLSVTSGAALTVEALNLPNTLYATVSDGEAETEAAINGITWQSEPEYADIAGTYVFTPTLPEGYTLADGVALPVITVTVQPPGIAQYAANVWNGSDSTAFSGSGTAGDPYIIASAAELAYLSQRVAAGTDDDANRFVGKYFKLTNDIDLNNQPWTPIGDHNYYFSGIFDGNGYCISGLNVTTANVSGSFASAGLFGEINTPPADSGTAAIKNLGVKGSITLTSTVTTVYCGGVVGYLSKGTVSGCYSNVNVSVSSVTVNVFAGSLAGYQSGTGHITACYATGDISVSTTGTTRNAGCVTGYRAASQGQNKLSACWDSSSSQTINGTARTQEQKLGNGSGEYDSAYALTTAQIKDLELLNVLGAAVGVAWKAGGDGWPVPDVGGTNPYASWVNGVFNSGSGTSSAPYTISDWKQLIAFTDGVNNGNKYEGSYIRLESDITLPDIVFIPIGMSNYRPFNGNFDGNNCMITGLTVNSGVTYCGLFGYIDYSGVIIGVNIKNGSVTSSSTSNNANTGLLAGYCAGQISYCNVQGEVTGSSKSSTGTGGLLGCLYQNQVTGCSFRGTVTGTYANATSNTGGLIGITQYGCVVICNYAVADITAASGTNACGLIGNRSAATVITGGYWNKDCSQTIGGSARGDGEKLGAAGTGGAADITAKTTAQMKTSDFNDELNTVLNNAEWGWSIDSTNDGFPYIAIRKPAGPAVDAAPTLANKTYNSITVNAVTISASNPDSTTVQYAIATIDNIVPSVWQSETTFNNLNASTTYYVYARAAESSNYNPGTAKVSAAITTDAVPPTYTLTINAGTGGSASGGGSYAAGTVVNVSAAANSNYSFSGWSSNNGGTFGSTSNASTTFTMPAGNTTITASFTYTGGSGSGGGGGGGGGGTPSPEPGPAPSPTPTPADNTGVFVDGNRTEAGTVTTEGSTTTVTLDQNMFDKKIETAKGNVTVVIPSDTGTAVAELVIKNVDDMAEKEMTLTVQTGNVQYEIPAAAVDTSSILAALGADSTDGVSISVVITTELSTAAQTAVNNALQSNGGTLVIPAMEFKLTATYDGKTVEISTFSGYVSRTVEVTADQAGNISTAVIVEPDGTTRHVPTYVYQENGKWYATVNSLTNSTYALINNEVSFTDAAGKWYEDTVNEMGSRGIISGIGSSLFAGERDITRAEFAAIIIRALGLPSDGNGAVFSDVSVSEWYCGAVGKAYEYDILSGVSDGQFAPDKKITRQEAMLMIQNAAKIAGYTGSTGNIDAFSDAGSVSDWALGAALWNVGSGLIVGSNGQLRPLDNITRAETATLVLKLLQKARLVDERTPLSAQTTQTAELMAYNPRKEPDRVELPDDNDEESPDPDSGRGKDGDVGGDGGDSDDGSEL